MTKKGIVFIIALLFMCGIAISQENAANEKWVKRWEERIKTYPVASNKIEIQLTKMFPTDEEKIFLNEAVSLAHDTNCELTPKIVTTWSASIFVIQ